jgi:outer membrane protein assembly factor BamB
MPGSRITTCRIRGESKSNQLTARRSNVRKTRNFLTLILVALAACILPASAQTSWKVLNTFHVGGDGGWDYVTVDAPNHRLFVTRSAHTQAIDEETGKVLGDIPGQIRSHGVALVPALGRGFITDGGGAGAIIVFDLKTYAVLGKIPAVPDADGIIYDEKLDRVLAVSGDGNELLTFSPDLNPTTGKLDPPIPLGGAPEFLAADGTGKVYINLEDKDLVAVVDLSTRKVLDRWPVAPGGHPVGMAMNPAAHTLFIGCRNPQMLVMMNTETGAIEGSLPIGAGVDATRFDAGQVFASTGDGTLTVAGQQNGKWIVEQTVATAKGARTMGLDLITHRIFLPTAELEPQATGRPRPKPGTFMIVEVGH